MAIICRKYNLLFIMTPRTACTSIGELLCKHYEGEFIPAQDVLDSRGLITLQRKHSTLSELIKHELLTKEEAHSLFKIAAVRNPFDSLVSLYLKQRSKYRPLLDDPTSWVHRSPRYADNMRYAKTHSFDEWLFSVSYRKVIKRLLGLNPSMFSEYTRGVNMVLRYETIEKDLKHAFRKADIPWKAALPLVNQTGEKSGCPYKSYYSRFSAHVVAFVYAADLREYSFQF